MTAGDHAAPFSARGGRAAAAFAGALGFMVLIGWASQIRLLTTGLPGYVPMKPNTALCFVLLGSALWLVAPNGSPPRQRKIAGALSIATLLLAAATLVEYSSGRDLGIDALFFRDALAAEGVRGQMAPQTAISLLLIATSILTIDVTTRRARWPAGALATLVLVVGLSVAVGYLYGARGLFALEKHTAMAVHTAIGLLALGGGVLLSRRDQGWLRLFFSDTAGGILARRLLPIVVFAPLLIGWIRVIGQDFGFYGTTAFGTAAFTVTIIVVFFVGVAANASFLDAADRRHRAVEDAIRDNEQALRNIMDASADVILTIDADSVIQRANAAAQDVLGYKPEELVGRSMTDLMPAGFPDRHRRALRRYVETGQKTLDWHRLELPAVRKDGRIVPLEISLGETSLRGERFFVGFGRDISDRKLAEQKIRDSEERYRALFESSPQPMWVFDKETLRFLAVNDAAIAHYGYSREEFLALTISDIRPAEDLPRLQEDLGRLHEKPSVTTGEWRHRTRDGTIIDVEISAHDFVTGGRPARLVLAIDITEQKRTLAAWRDAEERLNLAVEAAQIGTYDFNPITGDLKLSSRCKEILGLPQDAKVTYDTFLSLIHHEDRAQTDEAVKRSLDPAGTGEFDLEYRIALSDGTDRWVASKAQAFFEGMGEKRRAMRFIGTVIDITSSKEAEERLREQATELARSNADLQQFAYIASHDLQEPLRMISGYVQLLARRYKQRLDKDADEFIDFAVDGANRMQQLIRDLLAFSRLGTRGKDFQSVDCNEIVESAKRNLQVAIDESRARITVKPLPVVKGDPSQLVQLFQNLLGNAIKFRGSDDPRIEVSATCHGNECVFTVRDNGIGIESEYFDRIFTIFQRLHAPGTYQGTGIGLAVCKRIIERHGGRIWVESKPGQGSSFRFTLTPVGETEWSQRHNKKRSESSSSRTIPETSA